MIERLTLKEAVATLRRHFRHEFMSLSILTLTLTAQA
jgi:hypothetical protein